MLTIKNKPILAIAIFIAIALIIYATFAKNTSESEYKMFIKPDGEYHIAVYSYTSLISLMPGSSGDRPGVIKLYNKSNQLIAEKDIEMLQLIDNVEWSDPGVHIPLVVDWELPVNPRK